MLNKLPKTDIYAITDSSLSLGRSVEEVVKALIRAEIKIIQYREKNKDSGEMLKECTAIRRLTKEAGVFFIVNDHVDIAQLVEADGVHVGQDDLPLEAVRKLMGAQCVLGISAGNMEEAKKGLADGADYIGVGPVFPTNTKADAGAATGLSFLKELKDNLPIPFAAIGGINRSNIGEVAKSGACCYCLISEIVGAENIEERVAEIRAKIKA